MVTDAHQVLITARIPTLSGMVTVAHVWLDIGLWQKESVLVAQKIQYGMVHVASQNMEDTYRLSQHFLSDA